MVCNLLSCGFLWYLLRKIGLSIQLYYFKVPMTFQDLHPTFYLIKKLWVRKIFSNFSWHLLRIWLFCPKIEKDLGKFSFVESLICFVRLPSTMMQTFVLMHQRIYLAYIEQIVYLHYMYMYVHACNMAELCITTLKLSNVVKLKLKHDMRA